MLVVLNDQGDTYRNNFEVSFYFSELGQDNRTATADTARAAGKGKPYPVVRLQTSLSTLEISVENSPDARGKPIT